MGQGPMSADDLLRRVAELGERRDAALHLAPRCPACDNPQVQVTDWSVEPSEWRCRACGHRFVVRWEGAM